LMKLNSLAPMSFVLLTEFALILLKLVFFLLALNSTVLRLPFVPNSVPTLTPPFVVLMERLTKTNANSVKPFVLIYPEDSKLTTKVLVMFVKDPVLTTMNPFVVPMVLLTKTCVSSLKLLV